MYADDIFITGSCIADICSIKSSMHNVFSMTNLGLLKQFIRLEIEKYDAGNQFNQSNYALDLLLKFKMAECKASKCPFILGVKLGDFGSSPLVDNSLYRNLVRILLYLTHFRRDLDYALGVVAKYINEPHEIHWKDAKRILHYVQETKHFGIHCAASSPLELVGFTDSDWDRDSTNRNSTSCYVIMLAHGPIFM